MKIAGRQVNSFVDYDGNISYVVFTAGCNMNCWYCHNRDILFTKDYIDENFILDDIKKRTSFIDAVVITGGEPTIQNDLLDFIKKVKNLGLSVKLDTNGKMPSVLKAAVSSGMIDYVAMDIKQQLNKYEEITMVKEDIDKIRESINFLINQKNVDYEFRTTLPPTIKKEDVVNIAKEIAGAKKYVIQQYNYHDNCLKKDIKNSYSKKELDDIAKECEKYIKNIIIKA